MRHIIFTVTNDLNYDQRMIRICTSLHNAGYEVTLVGRVEKKSGGLASKPYKQKRLSLLFSSGPGFYVEYNIRLFFYLLFKKFDCACAIDLDSILAVYFATSIRQKKKVYDAHEYFSQLKEIVNRKGVYFVWHQIERIFVPRFKFGYTVSKSIADKFKLLYGVQYETIRNMPVFAGAQSINPSAKDIIYQGAVNEARGFEFLIPAMKDVNANLIIYGDGNFMGQAKKIVEQNGLTQKVIFKGRMLPAELNAVTSEGYVGINLVENIGLNQYFSLANKFFDYIQHGVPQVTMDFPEYKLLNEKYGIALLIPNLEPSTISKALNKIVNDTVLHQQIRQNCVLAARELNWQTEEQKLIAFYTKIFE